VLRRRSGASRTQRFTAGGYYGDTASQRLGTSAGCGRTRGCTSAGSRRGCAARAVDADVNRRDKLESARVRQVEHVDEAAQSG
jgi:hypothetical protein